MNITDYIKRQIDWSTKALGPGERTQGLMDHVKKELKEIEKDSERGHPTADEWVDVIILGLDGLWRSLVHERGLDPDTASVMAESMLDEKHLVNASREWPDWRTVEPGKAIEHVRTPEELIQDAMALRDQAKTAVEAFGIEWPFEDR